MRYFGGGIGHLDLGTIMPEDGDEDPTPPEDELAATHNLLNDDGIDLDSSIYNDYWEDWDEEEDDGAVLGEEGDDEDFDSDEGAEEDFEFGAD